MTNSDDLSDIVRKTPITPVKSLEQAKAECEKEGKHLKPEELPSYKGRHHITYFCNHCYATWRELPKEPVTI